MNENLYSFPKGVSTRWASPENMKAQKGKAGMVGGGRKGSAYFPVKAGESVVLAEESGVSGTIRRIWITLSALESVQLKGFKLEFYWDGCTKPAVSAPLGDFFGQGLGRMSKFQSAAFSSPEGKSFNCFIPMPFRTGMKVIVRNESGTDLEKFFYDIDYTVGDVHGEDMRYFHAFCNRRQPTVETRDYEILPTVRGSGRFLGCNVSVTMDKKTYNNSWFGEGEVKMYIDGDTEFPTLCGTGTEDYIGTGWGQGEFSHLYQGCTISDEEKKQYCFYRYHIPDPVYFSSDIRVTLQQIGCAGPDEQAYFLFNGIPIQSTENVVMDFSKKESVPYFVIFEMHHDVSSCGYFYLDRPENDFPPELLSYA